ncbi:GDYXXLXY domain-containing protein [Shewanella fodinae]|uniref:GDYXXLXY domain-containing protein n=1 Tax=Shewanella fodinae TaxID=552357 RepID=UPI00167AA5E2|nr:GDYXXLXY domain-containing protein [Shewanella fodinae]MCL2904971.1 GDYXXLXY domain-containing protein [Shewanella fodinae]GGY89560.1 membrane protein [Shewanella fodinae]
MAATCYQPPRKTVLWAFMLGLCSLLLVNFSVWHKEQLWRNGEPIILALAPKDPRSLMQGDYMALDYVVARELRQALQDDGNWQPNLQGWLLLTLQLQGPALYRGYRFSNADTDMTGQQRLLPFKVRNNRVRIASNAWFFEEGQAAHFDAARYGEFRLANDGELLLVGLLDENLQPL